MSTGSGLEAVSFDLLIDAAADLDEVEYAVRKLLEVAHWGEDHEPIENAVRAIPGVLSFTISAVSGVGE